MTAFYMKKMFLKWTLPALMSLISCFSLSAQDTLYATSQFTSSNGLCLTCRVLDKNNSVNSNRDDYTTLSLGASLLGANISQTLIFPQQQTDPNSEITIEIANNDGLAVSLLGSVAVSTTFGNIYNNDRYIIAADDVKHKPNSNRLIYSFRPGLPFDRVTVQLNAGLLALGSGMRIYGAYTTKQPLFNCTDAPTDVFAYYPLDRSVKDRGPHRLHGTTIGMDYSSRSICNLAAIDSLSGGKEFFTPYTTMADSAAAFSIWVKALPGVEDNEITVITDRYTVYIDPFIARFLYKPRLYEDPEYKEQGISAQLVRDTGYMHILANYGDQNLNLYVNGRRVTASELKEGINTSGATISSIFFRTINMIADELVIYNRQLSDAEIKKLAGRRDASLMMKPAPTVALAPDGHISSDYKNTLTVAPNPGSGTFRINGDIPIENSILMLTDLSGREVFRARPSTATVTLPGNVSPGVYVLRLQTKEGKLYSTKLVVHR